MRQAHLDELDSRLRSAIRAEPRILAALAYGSRTQLPGGVRQDDEFSDLEYYVYLHPGERLDPLELIGSVTPILLSVTNPFGTPNFVTPELHRIELHVQDASQMTDLRGWPGYSPDVARMLVKDEGALLAGLLARFANQPDWTPEAAQTTLDNVLNALVAVHGFLRRGERLRAHEWHSLWVVGGLTRLARHAEGASQPPAVARWAERDLSAEMLSRLAACAVGASELEAGSRLALTLAAELAALLSLDGRAELLAALSSAISPTPALSPPSSGG